jgi:hypothetical protein
MGLSMLRSGVYAATLAVATMFGPQAHAAPCQGFTDVDDASPFCPNVEWLKNRAITVGCTASTYCPADAVTRIAMAAFLRRLGDALTPLHAKAEAVGGVLDIDLAPVVCSTVGLAVTGAPRRAHGHAVLTAENASKTIDLAARFVESSNGGASWTAVSPDHAITNTGSDRPTINVLLPPRSLSVGSSYRYGLRLSRVAGSATTGDVGSYTCSVSVKLENRNAAVSPLDEDEDD